MRQPDEIVRTVWRRFDASWRDWLAAPPAELVLSLQPPSAAQLVTGFAAVDEWARGWLDWCAGHPPSVLRFADVRTGSGTQRIPTHLVLADAVAIATIAGDANRWSLIRERHDRLRSAGWGEQPVRAQLARIRDLSDTDFELLLAVGRWFEENPRSGLTMRQVPVAGLHTKWLAQHRALVIPLLSGRDSSDGGRGELAATDLDALGLRRIPPQIDILIADPWYRNAVGGIKHLRAPVEEIAALPLAPGDVLVVENKESALPIADRAGLVVVHSLGNHTRSLAQLPWLAHARCRYWGDLDRAGFTLLSRARAALPAIESVLMSARDVAEFAEFGVDDPSRVDAPEPNLTAAERAALDLLTDRSPALRIEQERIPWPRVETTLFT